MTDLKQICDRIRYLGSQEETPDARAEVEAAFALKWEGAQAVAARVLGHWGGRRSVELIKEWLLNYYHRQRRGGSIEKVAVDALLECFDIQDNSWILDIYFDEPRKNYFHSMISALHLDAATEARIVAETEHPEPNHRYAALIAIWGTRFLDAYYLFDAFKNDPDQSVRLLAEFYSNHIGGR